MSESVGGIHYDVGLETSKLLRDQRDVDRVVKQTTGSLDKLGTALNAVTRAVQLYAAALAVVKAATMADDMRLLGARVQVAAGSMQAGAEAMAALQRISVATQTSVAANASTFARLNQSLIQMGGTQADTLRLTELLAKAIKVSGASGAEASAAMLQFGQALGSGKLAGDELRSLLETAPYLMRQLADGLGVPIGALKSMGEQGKLTADVVMSALSKASDQISADFATFPQTVESAMTAMQDSAARANAKLDELTGTSTLLTGATQGLGQVLDKLAEQFGAANDEAGKLDRNDHIKVWADRSRLALSYLADGADVLWQTLSVLGRNVAFVFTGIGNEIGGIGAQVAAVMRGDFAGARAIGDAMTQEAAKRRADLDAADAATLNRAKTMGAQMREAWGQGAGGGRGFVNPGSNAAPSKLKATGAAGSGASKPKGAQFDATGYLSTLEAQTADAYTRIGIIEEEAKRKADDLLKEKKISVEQHAQAVKLIEANAVQDRQELAFREATENLRIIEESGAKELELRLKAKAFADSLIEGGMTPAEKLRLEEAEKLAALEEALSNEYVTREKYEFAKQALLEGTQVKLKEIADREAADKNEAQAKMLQGYGQMFDGMAGIVETFSGKQNAAYKVLFAASKAFAVAESIIKIQQGIANAAALPFPANLGAMATVAASTASIISTIKGTQYGGGRQYGGAVSANSLYRVNETGRPEMFTAANGSQYMMPTASGRVTSADKVGGGGTVLQVNVTNNHPTAQVTATRNSSGGVDVAVQEIARQIRDNSGPVWSALRGSSNVQGRLG